MELIQNKFILQTVNYSFQTNFDKTNISFNKKNQIRGRQMNKPDFGQEGQQSSLSNLQCETNIYLHSYLVVYNMYYII